MEGFFTESAKLPTNSSSEELDLTLKLSPCGQNAESKKLTRSSSIAVGDIGKISTTVAANGPHQVGPFVPSLDRYSSLPTEPHRGLLRGLMTTRRAEARRRLLLQKQLRAASAAAEKSPLVSPKVLPWSAMKSTFGVSRPEDTVMVASYNIPYMHPRGSVEGGDSSNAWASPKLENDSKEMAPRPADTKLESLAERPKLEKLGNYCTLKGDVMEILRQMPSVTTTGPNGMRIEGFLYRYGAGQVCIVCVCHGNFFTPAEFVMHAGAKEVDNPMKYINVYSNSPF